jgi:hypothetical protein
MRRSRRRIPLAGRIVGVFVCSMSLSGCFYPLALRHQATEPDTRPWWCMSELMDGEPGAEHYLDMGVEKGMLSWDDCLSISQSFDAVLKYVEPWPTRGLAEAAGWRATVNYVTGMGTHHALGNPLAGTFDPTRPTFLQYDGNGPDAKLVGVSWYVHSTADEPPEGFPGDNDWFHVHEYLCVSNRTGLVIRDGACQSGDNGTSVYLGEYWLVHAWIIPGWKHVPDVFVGHHPCLLASGPAPASDPCWDEALGEHMG